jgi:hypothetical protein
MSNQLKHPLEFLEMSFRIPPGDVDVLAIGEALVDFISLEAGLWS